MISETDAKHLKRCVELAEAALQAGDEPFGSVLVAADGTVLHEARNHAVTADVTRHPEFELAQWAAQNLAAADCASATVYTSGEHCPMCSAAHGWAGLGRIVYASSSKQLGQWMSAWGVAPAPITLYSINEVVPGIVVDGPDPELADQVRQLHQQLHQCD